MAKYKRQPIKVDAIQFNGTYDEELQGFLGESVHKWQNGRLYIATLESSPVSPEPTDWICRHNDGQIMLHDNETFLSEFEPV